MKQFKKFACLLILFVVTIFSYAQTKQTKIAVFAPLYLDSAFNGNEYKFDNNTMPKYILPGLEFYNGVMMAVDSLKADGVNAEVIIYDTKKTSEDINTILLKPEVNDVSLIIAAFNNKTEIKPLADFAKLKKIPLISETYPNDGNVQNNPYLVIINSTLTTHCEELYKFLQRYYATDYLVFFTRKARAAEIVQSIFSEMGRTTPSIPLKYKTIELPDNFSATDVAQYLDSNRHNIVICGSLNEDFGLRLIKTLSAVKNFKTTAIGMPTWDGFRGLDQAAYADEEIVYSSPFYFNKKNLLYKNLSEKYLLQLNAVPSDMMLKGYESMYHFSKLLKQFGDTLITNISDTAYSVFNTYNIKPIRDKKNIFQTNYLENRKLYFIKKKAGLVISVN